MDATRPVREGLIGDAETGSSPLPRDLLLEARNRLGWACLIFGLGYLLVYGLRIITTPGFTERGSFLPELVAVTASVVLAAGMALLTRIRTLPASSILDLGLIFQFLGGFGISFTEHWGLFGGEETKVFGISWVCVWIIIFPLLVPSPPAKAFLAAVATASTGILAYTLSVAFGRSPQMPFSILVELFAPNYIAAMVALGSARIVYRLHRDVATARQLGRYRLEESLGQGGMGEVWRASHRFLSRPAAIKLIRPDALGSGSPQDRWNLEKRFEREAQATAALQSPHSIHLYDYGCTEEGLFYCVMELLEGIDMNRLVRDFGPVSPARTGYLLAQVCHSLVDAHHRGLIHRDVKPANLFVCRMGQDYDFVKVLDFGLVRMENRDGDATLTAAGFAAGTPSFMAPEVILGTPDLDSRADLYSLGCVAYWLVTGCPVFSANSSADIFYRQLNEDPIPPSRRTDCPVPPDMDSLILDCLAKRPADRPRSAEEVMDRLQSADLGGRWSNDRARDWWASHRARFARTA